MIDLLQLEEPTEHSATEMPVEAIVHCLNTPLSAMYVNIQMLERHQPLDEASKILVANMRKSWLRMTKIIRDACDADKISKGMWAPEWEDADIVLLLKDMVEAARQLTKKNITLHFSTQVEEKIMALDKEVVERIVLNMIATSLKFTDENGSIKVSLLEKGRHLSIHVRNHGRPMSEDLMQNYQRPREDTDAKSLVLGLLVAKQLSALLGGHFYVERLNDGNNLSVSLFCFTVAEPRQKAVAFDSFYNNNIIQVELSDAI